MRALKYIIALAGLFLAFACTIDNVDSVRVDGANDGSKITICGKITRFTDCHVGTRANKTSEEAYVSEMVFAMFPVNDDNTLGNCVNYEVREGSNLLFTLDRSNIPTEYANKEFAMYIFTNMPELPDDGFTGTLDSLLNYKLENPGISRPEDGFPMIGSLGDPNRDGNRFVLMPMNGNRMELPTVNTTPTDYLNIPMYAVFAKMSFTVYVTPDQNIMTNKASMFEMTGYEIHNLPTVVSFDRVDNEEGKQAVKQDSLVYKMSDIAMGGLDGGDLIEFDFYLPERYVTPNTLADDYEYPFGKGSGISPEDEKYRQRYKPCLLGEGQKATFIRIKGKFRDHQEHYYDVSYDIYLGTDEYSNFDIIRNYEYINMVNIKGITSSKDQTSNTGGIAIDHRVTIDRSTPLVINFRRETQLDAHYEVRPMRLRLVGESIPNGTPATVEVLDKNGTTDSLPSWIRLEASGNSTNHITTEGSSSKGKRKYFTTDLVTNTLASNTSVTVGNLTGDNQAVWVYVDENTDTKSRAAIVRVSYGGDDKDYKIVQQGLYKVVGADSGKDYYIEQYEEYLYNYDAEDSYGQTEYEGMPWGLNRVQLSHIHDSFICNEDNSDWKSFIQKNQIKYDFYIRSHDDDNDNSDTHTKDGGTLHNFAGHDFTKEIAANTNAGFQKLTLADKANSAVEYCYNRNKRQSDGTIKDEDIVWYLPSADELEEFIVPAYASFEEFQDNYYWTSQPAYKRNAFYYEYYDGSKSNSNREDTYVFTVYEDNTEYARATKVVYANGNYDYAKSGLNKIPNDGEHAMDSDCVSKNANVYGYFNVMYGWYRWTEWFGLQTRTDEKIGDLAMKTDEHFDEYRDGDKTDKRYHIHLGHKVDEFFQVDENGEHGYHLRTEYNRVRCVRKMN